MMGSASLTLIAALAAVDGGVAGLHAVGSGGSRIGNDGSPFRELAGAARIEMIELGPASPSAAQAAERSEPARGEGSEEGVLEPIAYVATNGSCLNLRALPAAVSPSAACLDPGTAVAVLKEVQDWHKVRLEDGREGWLAARFLSAEAVPVTASRAGVSAAGSNGRDEDAGPPPAAAARDAGTDQLTARLSEAEGAIERLRGQINSSQSALDEAERARAELSRSLLRTLVTDLESRLGLALAELENSEEKRRELAGRIEQLEQDRRGLEGRIEEAVTDAQNWKTAAEETQWELDNVRAELERAHTERRDLEADLEDARSARALVESDRERLLAELETAGSELAQVETVASAARQALSQEIQETETTLGSLRRRLETSEAEFAAAQERLAAVEAERSELAAELADTGPNSRAALERELERATQALQEASRDNQSLRERLDQRQEEFEQAEAKTAIMQSEIDRIEDMFPGGRREMEGTRAALSEARSRNAELEGRLDAAEEDNRAMKAELFSIRSKLASLLGPGATAAPELEATPDGTTAGDARVVVLDTAAPCLHFTAEPKADGEALDCLAPGARLELLGHWQGWHYVELGDGRTGWVSSQHLGPEAVGGPGA